MEPPSLPSSARMHRAVRERDPSFDGVFVMGVRTTGIFCRASCPARRPAPRNVEFFADAAGAQRAGYRACLRCRPTDLPGETPAWLRPLLDDPRFAAGERVTDADVRALGLDPVRVRRWFRRHHGTTFQAFLRARRVGGALRRMRRGEAVVNASIDAGYESLSGFYDAFRRIAGTTPARGRGVVPLHLARLVTPLGPMVAAATDAGLCLLEFDDRRTNERELRALATRLRGVPTPTPNAVLDLLERELPAYFEGALRAFTTPLHLVGTEFQKRAWGALCDIPYGATISYGAQAAAIGRPSAVRAVAQANGSNRVAIVVPCHRVVGADGRLTGYAAGLWRKQRLLELERRVAAPSRVVAAR